MSQKMTRLVAKIIAITLIAAMVITSFTFVFYMGSTNGGVYAATPEVSTSGELTALANPLYTEGTSDDAKLSADVDYLEDLIREIQENYKDEISYDYLVNGAFEGVFESLGDPYSVYYTTADEGNSFVESVDGEFSGVGVSIADYNGQCKVVAPIAGTPADRAGILSGDFIVKVNGQDVSGLSVDTIATMLRGQVGTQVTVTILRAGKNISFTLTRELIRTTSVEYKLLEDKIGYISLSQFDSDSDNEFIKAKNELLAQGADSFIIDVRDNPGGYIAVAAKIAEEMMPAGAITHLTQKGNVVETLSADGSGDASHPIVLLVNGGSASASEILAGAWQDSKAAVLVGTTTFGKGIAQQMYDLKNGAAMKLSMYYFVTPQKKVIDKVGITPDYYVSNYANVDTAALTAQYETFAPMKEAKKPKAGETGLNVYGAQQRLLMLGYSLTVNGTMDQSTVAAVKTFQKQQGFNAYGTLDYATMNRLEQATTAFILGATAKEDLQMNKALELLK
ncbi:MAG: S41 family peptidase [Eubacteriales bacterium]|nr:S41 family peptidase [Eubacteriales bacterium]